ncbi:AAA family ATPase [Deinococcus sp. AJ005]|uniref:AAA family ATPase n=1 Tax=Deinococcus sp. AJ005 TaxID=2652443 RepID=UPI00125CCA9D|nr:AAA family ATPase [Deinococcus sp. AJ005]QFP75011.1 AAA domain-containing protein [Deinococcus sp. AJ005]
MAKKNKQARSTATPQPAPSSPTPAVASSIAQMVQAALGLHTEALAGATLEQQSAAAETAAGTDVPTPDLQAALQQARAAQELFQQRTRAAESRMEDANTKASAAERRGAEIQKERQELERERAAFRTSKQVIETERAALVTREEELAGREADAEVGFLQRREVALQNLRAELERLRTEASEVHGSLLTERQAHEKESRQLREDHAAQLHGRETEFGTRIQEAREALGQELRQLQEEQLESKRRLRLLEDEREELGEEQGYLRERAERAVAAQLERVEAQAQALEHRLGAAREERDRLAGQLDQRQDALRQFAGRTPEEVLTELLALRAEREQLRQQVERRPSDDALQRLRLLETERGDWEAERMQAVQRAQELELRLHRASVAVTELETLRDHKVSLETQTTLLRTALRELQADVDKHITSAEGKVIFPSCTDLDIRAELHEQPVLDPERPDLRPFISELQLRIASDPRQPLQYSLETLRSFVAGLAMSRLHLLQGISGTGKTSLPLAFARATGGLSAVTEVQSGWRDRADLVGHFNAFEKRFYESEFLQALYRASLPRYSDTPVMLVLDEMNLSHPEQYFASILSILENPERKQLALMEAPVSPAPALLRDGRILDLPENVWFIGTANHDETTKDFADKTYDRAHVMELPRHFTSVTPARLPDRPPLAYSALQSAFGQARSEYAETADQAYRYLNGELCSLLQDRFSINWGNRLERQMKAFVPVIVAAGGTVSEATDHILATKILRKIQNQFDVRPEDLSELQRHLDRTWRQLGAGDPVQSMSSIGRVQQRLGVGPVLA